MDSPVSEDHKESRCLRQQAKGINPKAEAEGFVVGGGHEVPTPALRDRCRSAPPLPRGDSQVATKLICRFRFHFASLDAVRIWTWR